MIVSLVQKFNIKSFAVSYGVTLTLQSVFSVAFCWEVHWIAWLWIKKGKIPFAIIFLVQFCEP